MATPKECIACKGTGVESQKMFVDECAEPVIVHTGECWNCLGRQVELSDEERHRILNERLVWVFSIPSDDILNAEIVE